MAYKVVSSRLYPFRRENAKFFSQELIEYILFAYGHIWTPKRSTREERLRTASGYIFTTNIGRLVLFVSQKYGDFIVMKCFNSWKSIMSQRPSIRERSLCNEIGRLCSTSELEQDNLGLFTFLAMMAEYARLAITSNQEQLVEVIVVSLAFCLTDTIPRGYIATLDRMICIANSFEYSRSYVTHDHNPERQFLSPVSTLSCHDQRSGFESPLSHSQGILSVTHYDTPVEEVEAEFKKREFRRQYFRRKNMIDFATQAEIHKDGGDCHVQSISMKTKIIDYVVKVDIKTDETLEDLIMSGELKIVERCDVCIQTGNINEEKFICPSLISDITGDIIATNTNVCQRSPVDSIAVGERLVYIQNVHLKETSTQKTGSKSDSSKDMSDKGNSERGETDSMVAPEHAISKAKTIEDGESETIEDGESETIEDGERETIEDEESETIENEESETIENEESDIILFFRRQLKSIKLKAESSKTDEGINVNSSDSQWETLDECSCSMKEKEDFEQDESFDSQIESSDESCLEN